MSLIESVTLASKRLLILIYLAEDPRPGPGPWPQWGLPWVQCQARTGLSPRPGPAAPPEAMGLAGPGALCQIYIYIYIYIYMDA